MQLNQAVAREASQKVRDLLRPYTGKGLTGICAWHGDKGYKIHVYFDPQMDPALKQEAINLLPPEMEIDETPILTVLMSPATFQEIQA